MTFEESVKAWVSVINDDPDPLHHDVTPAVVALSGMGIRVLPSILTLLDSSDATTRQRAQKILERVTLADVTARMNARPLSGAAAERWAAIWAENGAYQWDAPAQQRRAAIERWRQWTSSQMTP